MADPEQLPRRLSLWTAILTAAMAVVSLAMAVTTRSLLDYRFEVAAIVITWLALIVAPVLLSIALGRTQPVTEQPTARPEMSS
jgi:hypothetical protein